jgi:secondary thiamine-phosphate synthase enzyme
VEWTQKEIDLAPKTRGFHLVTHEICEKVPEIRNYRVGIVHIFVKHTSASITVNENADPTVRRDMEAHFNRAIPENAPYYQHTTEGSDDMPAHIKASVIGSAVTVPIAGGRMNLGVWQGIYLCEHRNRGGGRRLVVTIAGRPVEP